MVVEQRTDRSVFQETPFSNLNEEVIREFLPGWSGGLTNLGSPDLPDLIFIYEKDGDPCLNLRLWPVQGRIVISELVGYKQEKWILDEPFYSLRQVETAMFYEDEGRVVFFTRDKRGKFEISNKGRTLVYQSRQNRTDKTVTINLP